MKAVMFSIHFILPPSAFILSMTRPLAAGGSDLTLKNRLAKRREDQLDAEFRRPVVDVERSVYLDHFERERATRLRDLLHREVRLAVRESAAHDRAGARRDDGVERVNVERDVVARVGLRRNRDGLVHARAHPALVNLAHGEEPYAEFLYKLALARVNVPRADVRAEARVELGREAFDVGQLRRAVTEEYRERHAVNVSRRRRLRRVHVCVRVEPDEADRLFALAVERRDARDRADGYRMVAAEDDGQFPALQNFSHVFGQLHARRFYLAQEAQTLAGRGRVRRAFEAKVSEVSDFVAQLRDALPQSRDAHRRGAEVNARDARAEAARRSDDADATPLARPARGPRGLPLFFEQFAHAVTKSV